MIQCEKSSSRHNYNAYSSPFHHKIATPFFSPIYSICLYPDNLTFFFFFMLCESAVAVTLLLRLQAAYVCYMKQVLHNLTSEKLFILELTREHAN